MNSKKNLKTLLALAAVVSTWVACVKSDLANFDGVQLSPTVAIPLVKASFAFQDFIKSDSLIKTGADGTVQIIYAQDNIATYSVADIVKQATGNVGASVSKNIVMGNVTIAGFTTQKSTTLSAVGAGFSEPQRTLFTLGGTTPPTGIPAFTQNTNTQSDLADLADFQSVTLANGIIQLSVQNGFPFPLINQKVDLLDRGNGNSLITTITIGNIPAGGTTTANADLSNKTFTNKLAYRIPTISSGGIAANTTVSPSSTISVTATGSSMKLKTGIVKLPAQNLPAESLIAPVTTGNTDQKLREVTVASASASYTITKSIATNFSVDLTFPSIKENGVPVKKTIAINSNSVSGTINFTNAVIDLTTIAAQPYNQLPVETAVSLLASPGFVTINATDAIAVNTTMSNFKIQGAKGQFGTFNINIPTNTINFGYDFSFLNKSSQKLIFDNPVMNLRYTNSFGIPVVSNMNVSANGLLGSGEALNMPIFDISYPKINQLGMTVKDSFSINKSNSRVVPFLSILPNSITYGGAVQMKSSNINETNFFTADSKINLGAEFVLPLKFSTENLILRDTVKGDLGGQNVDNFESASLLINHNNGFPLKTSIDIVALKGGVSTTVVENLSIPAATVGADGRVSQINTGVQTLTVNKAQLAQLLQAEKLIIVGRIQTSNGGSTPVAILTSYSFDVSVGMKAQLKFKG